MTKQKFHEITGLGYCLRTMKECAEDIMKYELYKYPKASSCDFNEFTDSGIRFHLYKRWGRDDREFIQSVDMPFKRLDPYLSNDFDLYEETEYTYTGPTEEMKAEKIAHEEAERAKLAAQITEQNKKLRAEEYARFLSMKNEVARLSEKFEGK